MASHMFVAGPQQELEVGVGLEVGQFFGLEKSIGSGHVFLEIQSLQVTKLDKTEEHCIFDGLDGLKQVQNFVRQK